MDFFDSYRIEHDRDGYTITLYLNPNNTEFADELGHIRREKCADLYTTVQTYVNNKFPSLKVTTVKVMLGSMLIALIPLGPKPVKAMETVTAQTATSTAAAASSYTTYSVALGDNLWNIATKFKSSVSDIKTFNRLTTDILQPGQALRIPNGKVYTVSAGDTLWGISRSFNVTVDALKSYNSLTSDTLFLGQNLVIPQAPAPAPSTAPAPSQGTASGTPYIVVSGDTLWGLASRFGITVDSLKSYNNLTTDLLSIGQRLIIPPAPLPAPAPTPAPAPNTGTASGTTYTVVSGDTLWTLSRKFNISVDYLKSFNKMDTNTLYIGQVLNIPTAPAPAPAPTPTQTPSTGVTQGTTPAETTTVALPSNIPPELRGAAPTITYINHSVVSGENSWTIALKYGIPSYELLRVNNLTEASILNIGQVLRVPVHNVPSAPTMGANYGELLDWWTQAQYVFPINKVARVIDLRSGKSFYVKRTIGANHSDTEPLTSTDSAVIKDVWGGTYAWSAHPVIVEVDGRRIAAAMYSMPHGIEYILDNNFSGHFDIHFLNSTRHKDGLLDPAMQDAVKQAAGLKSI